MHGTWDRSGFNFREIADVGEAFEVVVLSPEDRVLAESGGVDEGVCHGEVVDGR